MTRMLLAALLCVVTAPALAQSATDAVLRLDSAWARMYQTHDTTFARALYADDLIWTSVSGALKDKRTELADVAPAPGLAMDYFRISGQRAQEVGTAVVVTGIAEWRYTLSGRAYEVARRYTIVYGPGGTLGWRIHVVHIGNVPRRVGGAELADEVRLMP